MIVERCDVGTFVRINRIQREVGVASGIITRIRGETPNNGVARIGLEQAIATQTAKPQERRCPC